MRRIFLPPGQRLPMPGETLSLGAEGRHRLLRVLRLSAGDRVLLLDGSARAEAVLLADGALRIERREPAAALPGRVMLLLALLKGDKMDWVVQKAVELGVGRLLPVACARSVRRLEPARARMQQRRWQRIAMAAAEQCRRDDVPAIELPCDLETAMAEAQQAPLRLLVWEGAAGPPLRASLPPAPPARIALLVGPEGGLAPEEVAAARQAGFILCGLGPRILRAETAALAALAVLADWAGD
ncbi:MAG: 16S rRNA (uracil(1498)-N(3))-methyltransferase [Myxococcales bacterium]|nr:16S rRNA (uracil(1498)-N(3))-methyltransferase [Myxococcota bacterium]MDW8281915.1 16S rRNA (uracil(1498)-N(3))-methyltransferase [Myxococcales bacterium]